MSYRAPAPSRVSKSINHKQPVVLDTLYVVALNRITQLSVKVNSLQVARH